MQFSILIRGILVLFFCVFVVSHALADVVEQEAKAENSVVSALAALIDSIEDIKKEIADKEKEQRAIRNEDQKEELRLLIKDLYHKIEEYEKNFERVATRVEWTDLESESQQDFDWQKEIREIFQPVVNGLKKITERPMQIEKLRTELNFHQIQLKNTQNAIENIQALIPQTEDKNIIKRIKPIQTRLVNRERQIQNQINITSHNLDERLQQKPSIWYSGQHVLRIFFKSRGRNLILAILSFVSVFLFFNLSYRFFKRILPIYRSEHRPFYLRLFEVIYQFLTYIIAIFTLLIVLYVLNDWILLSLVFIFSLGIAWAAKQGLAQFWEQTKIMLNIGAVRENERILYNGVPYRVCSLSLYSKLENPNLSTPRIRVPLKDLIGKTSRPSTKDEPWFPCKSEDWVLLSDGTVGRVGSVSQEFVQLFLGALPKFYPTQTFLGLTPSNLSKGFFITSTFGIDYAHQHICTKEVPQKLKEMLTMRLAQEEFSEEITDVIVQFKEAASSSLDLLMIALFTGKAAPFYFKISRLLQQIAVEAANIHGWNIPFPQVTYSNRDIPAERPPLLTP